MKKAVAWCENGEIPKITAKTVAEYAKCGDEDALGVFRKSAEMLGKGLAVLVDILNPERIVIGSVYARCEDIMREPMYEALAREALPEALSGLEILPASLGEQIGDYAAISVASDGYGRLNGNA